MTQKIIIFEGADRSGKTTIAQALSKQTGIPYFKAQRDKKWWDPMTNLNYYTEGITQCIEQTGMSIILDRWHGSDFAYSRLFDRDISYRKIYDIDSRLAKLNAIIVYCYKTPAYYIDDPEDAEFINKTMYTKMNQEYKIFSKRHSKCRQFWLNTDDEDLKSQITAILNKI